MDKFWSRFVSFIFLYNFWNNSIFAEEQCQHPCIDDEICNFISVQDTCYYVYKDGLRNWEDSKQHCQAEGLEMIKIDNANINNITKNLLDGLPAWATIERTKAWLGGRAHNYANWNFVNGVSVKGEQFGDIAFRNPGGQYWAYCGSFFPAPASSSPFFISVQSCDIKGNYLCRKRHCTSPANRNCLIFIDEQKNWFEARFHCMDMGGDLFYLKGDEHISQFNLVGDSSVLGEVSYVSHNTYIGIVHRQWEWHDTSKIIYTNWADGEPNAFWQECLMMYGDNGKWDDNVCDAQLLTLCQGEATETTTTSTTTTQSQKTNSTQGGLTPPNEPTTTLGSSATSISEVNAIAAKEEFVGKYPSTNKMIVIIMGVLLGVFFLFSIALIIFIICRRCQKKEEIEEIEDTEIIDNNYYEGTVERTVIDVDPGKSETTKNYVNGNAGDRRIVPEKPTGLPSYEDVHLYGNDVTDSMPKNKPVLKPKPKIGPVNGDVYSQVSLERSVSPILPNNNTTYINAN